MNKTFCLIEILTFCVSHLKLHTNTHANEKSMFPFSRTFINLISMLWQAYTNKTCI